MKSKLYKNKQLPKPRTRYYVGGPVIVLDLAEYEQLANHLTDVALLDRQTQLQQAVTKERHTLVLRKVRADIKAAKQYYKVNATAD